MKVMIHRQFSKDFTKLPRHRKEQVLSIIKELEKTSDVDSVSNLKQIKGYHDRYRIRLGDYRIGLSYKDDQIVMRRVLSRGDIYKKFP